MYQYEVGRVFLGPTVQWKYASKQGMRMVSRLDDDEGDISRNLCAENLYRSIHISKDVLLCVSTTIRSLI